MKRFVEDTIPEKVCNLLCRFNLPCLIAIVLGYDGLCTYDFPCLIYTFSDANMTNFVRKNPVRLGK